MIFNVRSLVKEGNIAFDIGAFEGEYSRAY
jgi:hypothetical protein